MSGSTSTASKRALLIGIDAYPQLSKLAGCVNDVELMRTVLVDRFGFPPAHVTCLTNETATRDAILAALDQLVTDTAANDIVVIHYAGHGSQMTDREGDEPSGYDNTIMPFDTGRSRTENRDITDDEIYLRLLRLGERTPFTTLLFDCCHSGTIARDDFGVAARWAPPDTRPPSELPPSPIPEAYRRPRSSGASGWLPLNDRYVLIAACRDDEVAYEYRPPFAANTVRHGALSYFLAEQLNQATRGTTYRDVFERAAALVNAANARQHPQLEGKADREVFGVADITPMKFTRVTGRTNDTVTLATGAALGATIGSRYHIYPQSTKDTRDVPTLGVVEITQVRATTADARITTEASVGAISADARAVEIAHAYGELRFAVQLVAPPGFAAHVRAMHAAFAESHLLRLVDDAAAASARCYLLAPRAVVAAGDPVPQLGAITAPVWAVVRTDGELAMSPKRLDLIEELIQDLVTLARHQQALALDNAHPASALRGKFELELLRRTADGEWVSAEADPASGEIVYEEGELIDVRITSRHKQPVYVSLLDFGLTGAVQLAFPPPGAQEQLGAGKSFTVARGIGIPLEFPPDFAVGPSAQRGALEEGVESIKLIVSTREADFSFIEQGGVRSAPADSTDSPLLALWRAATCNVTRDFGAAPVPAGDEDWTTVVRSFHLRRKHVPRRADARPTMVDA